MPLDQEFDVDKIAEEIRNPEAPKEMSFLDHLEELRWHIIRSVVAILAFAIAAFIFPEFVFDTLIFGPKSKDFWTYNALCEFSYVIYHDSRLCIEEFGFKITNITMAGQFTMHMFVSLIAGVIAAFPYVLFEIWSFIRPALSGKERRNASGLVFYGTLLFAVGVLFGYYFLSPISVNFMGMYRVSEEVENLINLESYITFVTTLTLGSGLMFELPLLVYFLAKLGLISSDFMKKYRRYALLIILVVSAIVTPPDVASQILMTIPIYGLYEVGIFIARRVERRNALNIKP